MWSVALRVLIVLSVLAVVISAVNSPTTFKPDRRGIMPAMTYLKALRAHSRRVPAYVALAFTTE